MKIEKVWSDEKNIYIVPDSRHTIGNPLEWYTRLSNPIHQQRNNYEIGSFAESLHWPDIDEDLSLESFLILIESCIMQKYSLPY